MDWKNLIVEIRAAGLSQLQIGERLGRSQAWVSATARGLYDDLKWSDGQALIALHAAETQALRPPATISPYIAQSADAHGNPVERRQAD